MSRDKLISVIADFKQFAEEYPILIKIYGEHNLIFINSKGYVISELHNKKYIFDLNYYPLNVYLI